MGFTRVPKRHVFRVLKRKPTLEESIGFSPSFLLRGQNLKQVLRYFLAWRKNGLVTKYAARVKRTCAASHKQQTSCVVDITYSR